MAFSSGVSVIRGLIATGFFVVGSNETYLSISIFSTHVLTPSEVHHPKENIPW